MDRVDRMTIDLLNHYAFVLHEDINNLTDEEINKARDYAKNYLERKTHWEKYDSDFEFFVNRQRFNAMTNNNYIELEKLIYQIVKDVNDLVNIDDWELDIYYCVDYQNKLLLSRLNTNKYREKIDFMYDIDNRKFIQKEIPITDEMDKLGTINYNSYSFYDLYNVRI